MTDINGFHHLQVKSKSVCIVCKAHMNSPAHVTSPAAFPALPIQQNCLEASKSVLLSLRITSLHILFPPHLSSENSYSSSQGFNDARSRCLGHQMKGQELQVRSRGETAM